MFDWIDGKFCPSKVKPSINNREHSRKKDPNEDQRLLPTSEEESFPFILMQMKEFKFEENIFRRSAIYRRTVLKTCPEFGA